MPESITVSYEKDAADGRYFQMVIPFAALNSSSVLTRCKAMIKTLELPYSKVEAEKLFLFNLTLTQIKAVNRYFYTGESHELRFLAEEKTTASARGPRPGK